ncbi:MAG: flagellar biosynthetic protein FliR, partial [Sphingopyxis sp.]
MIPTQFAGLEHQLFVWLIAAIRPGAAFLAAPLLGAAFVPVQLRFVLALGVGVPAAASAGMALPVDGLVSFQGFALTLGEVMAGLSVGFAVQIGYSAALVAGEVIGNAMGIGFAAMVDPSSGHSNPVMAQLLSVLSTFLFFAIDGHLILAGSIIDSYHSLPPGQAWLSYEAINGVVLFGSTLFSAGLAIALPVGFAIILVQIVMAMLARSAPQLNLFAVG